MIGTQSGYLFFRVQNDRDAIGQLIFWDAIGLLEMGRNRKKPICKERKKMSGKKGEERKERRKEKMKKRKKGKRRK